MIHFCLCVYHQVLRLKFGVMNEHYFMSNRNFNRLQVHAMALWQGVEHQMFSTAQHSTYHIKNISNKQFYVVSCSHGCFHIVVVVVVHKFILSKKQRTKHSSNKCWRSINARKRNALKGIKVCYMQNSLDSTACRTSCLVNIASVYIFMHWIEKLFNRIAKCGSFVYLLLSLEWIVSRSVIISTHLLIASTQFNASKLFS